MKRHCPAVVFTLLLSIFLALPAWGFGTGGFGAEEAPVAAYGFGGLGGTGEAGEESDVHTIIDICDPADYGYTLSVITVADQAALQALIDADNNALQDWFCMDPLNTRFGRIFPLAMPADWDLNSLDFTKGGLQYLKGKVRLGDVFGNGVIYQLEEGLQNEIAYPIYVQGTVAEEDVITLQSVESMVTFLNSLVIPVDSDPQPQISALLQDVSAVCFINDSVHYSARVSCNTATVNSTTPGLYPVSLLPKLPAGLVLPQGFSTDLVYVGVVDPNYIDLSAAMHISAIGTLRCTFLYTPQDPASVALEYSTDGAITWKTAVPDPMSTARNLVWNYANYSVGQHQISFLLSALTPGVSYAFRFTYDQDQVSNVLHIQLTEEVPQFKITRIGGDVDGGDQGEQEFPGFQQPAPSPDDDDDDDDRPLRRPSEKEPTAKDPAADSAAESPAVESPAEELPVNAWLSGDAAAATGQTASGPVAPATPPGTARPPVASQQSSPASDPEASEPVPVTEQVTDSATSLSGTRLNAMAALGDTVLFEKQGVALSLPSEFVNQLALKDNDVLTVTIDRLSSDSFSLLLELNGVPLGGLPESELLFPWEGEAADLVCVDESGGFVSPAVFHEDSGTVSCLISAAGIYRIQASDSAGEPGTGADTPAGGENAAPTDGEGAPADTAASPARSFWLWLLPAGAALIIIGGLALLRKRRHG